MFTSIRSIEYLYENVLPSLGGTKTRIEDRRCWSHGQIAGSCATSSVFAFLRSRMTAPQFKDFREIIRRETFLEIYREAKEGTATTHTVNVALEIARKLQHRIHSPELTEAHHQLEQLEAVQTVRRKSLLTPLKKAWRSVYRSALRCFDFLRGRKTTHAKGNEESQKEPSTITAMGDEESQKEPSAITPLFQVFQGLKKDEIYTSEHHRRLIDMLNLALSC